MSSSIRRTSLPAHHAATELAGRADTARVISRPALAILPATRRPALPRPLPLTRASSLFTPSPGTALGIGESGELAFTAISGGIVALRLITRLGSPAVRATIVAAASSGLVLKGRRREAAFIAATTGGAGLLNKFVKKLVGRNRPGHVFGIGQRSSSFPSGHSSGTVALVGSLCALLWHTTRNPRLTTACATCSVIWSAVVGYSRVKLRRHHVGDVAGGYALGLLWLGVCGAMARAISSRTRE